MANIIKYADFGILLDFYIRYSIIGIRRESAHMVIRKEYLGRLLAWKDEQVIKVVTGIRRCGKSTLLKQFQDARCKMKLRI